MLAVVLAAAAPSACAGRRLALTIETADGRPLDGELVGVGDTFVVAYVHSSEQVPVRGVFAVERDGRLRVVETAFAGFGPGLPELREGDTWRLEDGMIVHRPDGAPLSELTVHVLPITRHRLTLPSGRELDLSAIMGTGGAVRVSVR